MNGERTECTECTYGLNRTECTYGLKTNKGAPHVNDLNAFEEDLVKIADNIDFRVVRLQFLNKLSSDTKRINKSFNVKHLPIKPETSTK